MLILLFVFVPTWALNMMSVRKLTSSISTGFQNRVEADPFFPMKSTTELLLAAGTQLFAEWNRRGSALLPELDFVIAGVLTAMVGKYYTMWRVAPTLLNAKANKSFATEVTDSTVCGVQVPSNAFQATLIDGFTKPSPRQRMLSFFSPMTSLFQAGVVASTIGYGLTALLIALRSVCVPTYVATTRSVNILHASIYTGAFMAIISNLRYQVLQGVVEPHFIDKLSCYPMVHSFVTFLVRLANGFLGSVLAIMGMRILGLQQRK